jgi:CheY-like chemotaxis protein
MLPHVFDLFSQAERSLDRSQGGLGLGLTLVRRLVQMHGGRAYAESAGLGRGSRFVVELPAIHHAEMPISVAPPAPRSLKRTRHRVLVVDDNRDAAHSLGLLLKASGHEVITRYDGPSAIEELSRFEPSVVLLDIGLPGMSGYDVARCIRNSRQELLLVAVTGYGQEEDYRSTAAAGFDRHLVKPVDLQTLHKLLESATQSAPTA